METKIEIGDEMYAANLDEFSELEAANVSDNSLLLAQGAANEDVKKLKVGTLKGTFASKSALEGGTLVPSLAKNLNSWAQRSEESILDEFSEAIRTTAGSNSIDSEKQARLLSITANGSFKATSFNSSRFNLLNPSAMAMVGGAYVFAVPKMVRGAYGSLETANGILFTDNQGNNLNPTVRLSATYPTSASDGTAVTPYQFTGHTEYFYPASTAGYFIVSGLTVAAANVCAHIAWSKDYNTYAAFVPAYQISFISIITALVATHSAVTDKMLSVGSVADYIEFGAAASTWHRKCSAITPTWTNTLQEDGTYLHTATIANTNGAMKAGGAAELIGHSNTLTVDNLTVSFADSNATCDYSVKYELESEVTGTVVGANTYSVNDMGVEYMTGIDGSFIAICEYSQGIPDTVYSLIDRMELVEAYSDKIDDTFELASDNDSDEMPKICGQPMKLFGAGTPQESVVPTNWKQFADGGYNWNGLPSALGQEYINTSVASGGHYIAVRDGKYLLKWYQC